MRRQKNIRCLNCRKRIGRVRFCPYCGQENRERRVTVRQILHEFLGDYFTFDSKFFHSLIPLVIRPGFLSKAYISGQRVRYISPFRLYLFVTLVFFFILVLNTRLDQKRIEYVLSGEERAASDSLRLVFNKYSTKVPEPVLESLYHEIDTTYVLSLRNQPGRNQPRFTFDDDEPGDSRFLRYLHKKGKYLNRLGDQGWTLFLKATINQIPKVLFLILPLFALALKILYARHRIYYIEHFIFTLHFHTFVFLILILPVLLPKWLIIIPVLLIIYIYLVLAMRTFYGQALFKTWIKTQLLLFLYSFVFLPALVLTFLLAVITV